LNLALKWKIETGKGSRILSKLIPKIGKVSRLVHEVFLRWWANQPSRFSQIVQLVGQRFWQMTAQPGVIRRHAFNLFFQPAMSTASSA